MGVAKPNSTAKMPSGWISPSAPTRSRHALRFGSVSSKVCIGNQRSQGQPTCLWTGLRIFGMIPSTWTWDGAAVPCTTTAVPMPSGALVPKQRFSTIRPITHSSMLASTMTYFPATKMKAVSATHSASVSRSNLPPTKPTTPKEISGFCLY